MLNICIRHVLKESEDRDPNKDPAQMTMRDWGKLKELMVPMLLNFRNLEMHVIFTAQEKAYGNDDESTVEIGPEMSGASRSTLTACPMIIGRTFQKEVRSVNKKTKKASSKWVSCMLVGPHDEFITKDRTYALPRVVRNPTMPMFIEAAKSNLVEDE